MKTYRVNATWTSTHIVEIDDDLYGEDAVTACMDLIDSSTAELVDWYIQEEAL